MSERVAHIPRGNVEQIDGYERMTPIGNLKLDVATDPERTIEPLTYAVELVAYTVVWRRRTPDIAVMDTSPPIRPEPRTEVLVGARLDDAGEARLHGDRFVGWGGHLRRLDRKMVEEGDGCFLHYGARREVREELQVEAHGKAKNCRGGIVAPSYRGALYTDEDDVSRDHVAAIFSLRVDDAEVRETDKYAGEWMRADDLPKAEKFETWSALLIPHLDELTGG